MNIQLEKATVNDIDALTQIRLDYLTEDYGSLTEEPATAIIKFAKQKVISYACFQMHFCYCYPFTCRIFRI